MSDAFFALATLPLPDVEPSVAELERCVGQLDMVGVICGSNVNGMRLDHPVPAPIFEKLDRRGTTVVNRVTSNLDDPRDRCAARARRCPVSGGKTPNNLEFGTRRAWVNPVTNSDDAAGRLAINNATVRLAT